MSRWHILMFALVLAGSLGAMEPSSPVVQVGPNPSAVAFFETKIRPVFKEHCWKCHGNGKKHGGLKMDTLDGLLAGGNEGVALVPGDSSTGLLMKALRYESGDSDLDMPPKGKLPDAVISDIARWIDLGAPWPTGLPPAPLVPPPPPPPFLGRLHPAIVHLPITALVLAILTEFLRWWRGPDWRKASDLLIAAGALGAIAGVISGSSLEGGQDPRLLERHELLGWLALVGALSAGVLAVASRYAPGARRPLALVLVLTGALVILAGHLGGEMVHGPL